MLKEKEQKDYGGLKYTHIFKKNTQKKNTNSLKAVQHENNYS